MLERYLLTYTTTGPTSRPSCKALPTRPVEGERRYESAEHEFSVACTHDALGTVTCVVVLSRPWPPAWSYAAELQFGAGAHLQRIADEVSGFTADTTSE
jgi:hypothetical protein